MGPYQGNAISSLFGPVAYTPLELLPFPAQVTGVTLGAGGQWRYSFVEQSWDGTTGAWVNAVPGRFGDIPTGVSLAFEAQNQQATCPFFVNQMRPRGLVAGQMVYDFDAPPVAVTNESGQTTINVTTTTLTIPQITPVIPITSPSTQPVTVITVTVLPPAGFYLEGFLLNVGNFLITLPSPAGPLCPLMPGDSVGILVNSAGTVYLKVPSSLREPVLDTWPATTALTGTGTISPAVISAVLPVSGSSTPICTGIIPPTPPLAGQALMTMLVNLGSAAFVLRSGGGGSYPFLLPLAADYSVPVNGALLLTLNQTTSSTGTWYGDIVPITALTSGSVSNASFSTGSATYVDMTGVNFPTLASGTYLFTARVRASNSPALAGETYSARLTDGTSTIDETDPFLTSQVSGVVCTGCVTLTGTYVASGSPTVKVQVKNSGGTRTFDAHMTYLKFL